MISEAAALKALPPQGTFLHDYVMYAQTCTDAHVAHHLLGGLICLAQTLPVDLGLPLGDSPLFGNLYALCVGPSTESRKSVSLGIARNLLSTAEIGGTVEAPGSAEGLLEMIRDTPRCLVAYSEFGSFLAQTEHGYATPIKTLLTDAYDTPALGRALANKRRGAVEKPRVSVFGASTLDFLERHTEPVDWTGGFLGRFLTMYSGSRERTYTRQPTNPQGRKALVDRLQTLISVDSFAGPCEGFRSETDEIWDDWYYSTEKRAKETSRETKAAIARAPGMAMKIALILAWDFGTARAGQPWHMGLRELEHAIHIVELHIDSVLEIGDHLAPSRDLRDRLQVLHVVPADRPMALGEIISRAKVGLKKRVQDLLATLEEEGLVARATASNGRTDLYVRPLEDVEQAAQASNVVRLFGQLAPSVDSIEDYKSEPHELQDDMPKLH